jgi:phosphohistidine phosphatase
MRIFFMRHGPADRGRWSGADSERPLTPEGREEIEKSARRLREIGLRPDHILTSPLVRARQTAEIVAGVLESTDGPVVDHRVDPAFDVERLRSILSEYAGAQGILIVGHEPSLSEVVGVLIGGGTVVCKKGSVARVDLETPESARGELVWLLQPRTLIR